MVLYRTISATSISNMFQSKESAKDVFDALRAYTERHYQRLEKTTDERFVLLWALRQMHQVSDVLRQTDGETNGHGQEHEEDVLMLDGA